MDFVEICNVYVGRMILEAAKRIFSSDKICRSYSDLNFGSLFWNTVYSLSCFNKYTLGGGSVGSSDGRSTANSAARERGPYDIIASIIYCSCLQRLPYE